MLSKHQIHVLQYIIDNCDEYIINLAEENDIKTKDIPIGIANFLVAAPENFSKMKAKQEFYYSKTIEPLIHKVFCDGMYGENEDGTSSCIGDEYIDEDSLLEAYMTQDMRCQHCKSTTESWHHNNP